MTLQEGTLQFQILQQYDYGSAFRNEYVITLSSTSFALSHSDEHEDQRVLMDSKFMKTLKCP